MECSVLLTRGRVAREVGGALKTECACNTSTSLIMLITTIRNPKQSEIIRNNPAGRQEGPLGEGGGWGKILPRQPPRAQPTYRDLIPL